MKPRWTAASMGVVALAAAMLPMVANAAPLPAPSPNTPTADAVVDQPVFSWAAVDDAKHYEIEVALDDQFVTVTDPGDEQNLRVVHGTTYVPTYTYTAKTHYWHVRAVSQSGSRGLWSETREFTRRWTNDDEPAGTEQDIPASRVENFGTLTGDLTPPLNEIGFVWDAVPGASLYQVQFSSQSYFPDESSVICETPHRYLAPYFDSPGYKRRDPFTSCEVNSPVPPEWTDAEWSRVAVDSPTVTVVGSAQVGDRILVEYLSGSTVIGSASVQVLSITPGSDGVDATFTIPATGAPDGLTEGQLRWYKPELRFTAGGTYFARVRAVDNPVMVDYPNLPSEPRVYGLWSDQRRETDEVTPGPLSFTPDPSVGTEPIDLPVVPDEQQVSGTDLQVLSWPAAVDAVAYRVIIALDRDFTNRVGEYFTRSRYFVPDETYDDNGPAHSYYWFATPCVDADTCEVPDRLAINTSTYVGRFAKRSTPVTDLSATAADTQANVVLRWGDDLSAARALDSADTPGGVTSYDVQFTTGDWEDATTVTTDNLAYSTAEAAPLPSGTYAWRVRPHDGQDVPLAWAYGTDFTIVKPTEPDPTESPSTPGSSPSPSSSTEAPGPVPEYQAPPPADGAVNDLPPEKPGKPTVRRSGRKYVRVRWQASEELGSPVTRYLIYRSKDSSNFSVVKRTTSRTVRVKAAKKKTYWFYVVADSEAGRSDRSSITKYPK